MIAKEVFKEIPSYEGKYWISNYGNVKTFYQGKYFIKKSFKDKLGYLKISLSKNNERKTVTIHRLVALVFVPNPYNYKEINHIDGNKENNYYENLEWCTRSQNVKHAFETGLKFNKKGEESLLSVCFNQFDLEGNFIRTWKCVRTAAKELGIADYRQITQNLHGRSKTCMGYIFSFEDKINIKEHKPYDKTKKPVIGFNPITKETIRYDGVLEAEKDGFIGTLISKCCRGIRVTHKGYIWRYEED